MNHPSNRPPVHFHDTGGAGSVIVFIHGWSCGHDDWAEQSRALSADFRCIAIDLPGHGRSARPETISIEAMAVGVNAVLDYLAIEDAVLVGHSMGCRVAMQVWADQPKRVRGIIHADGSLMEGDLDAILARFQSEVDSQGADHLIDRLYEGFAVDSTPQSVRDALARRRRAVDPGFLVPLLYDMVRWDIALSARTLARIDIPVMVMQSTLLDATGKRVAIREGESTPWTRSVRQHLPGARIVTIGGIGHFPMMEASGRTNELIRGFVESLAPVCHHPHDGHQDCDACR